jgi:hypothetical protein
MVAAEWGGAARELARYHIDRVAGRDAIMPPGAAELHGGRGAPEPTAAELRKLELTAWTRAEHLALHEYFLIVARKKGADADGYRRLAMGYRAAVRKGVYDPVTSYERMASLARKEAKKATEAGNRHRQLATIAWVASTPR